MLFADIYFKLSRVQNRIYRRVSSIKSVDDVAVRLEDKLLLENASLDILDQLFKKGGDY